MDKKVIGGTIIALIAAVASGGLALSLDFSNTQSTDNSRTDNSQSTVINEGDTIINEIIEEVLDEEAFIDYVYDEYCEEIAPESAECDEYWEEWD